MASGEKVILVKSSTAILGPYSEEELVNLLMNKYFSLIDEVKWPNSRWIYIRETPAFAAVVEKLRKDIEVSKEDTVTNSFTATMTISTKEGALLQDDLTPTPHFPSEKSETGNEIRDITPLKEITMPSSQALSYGSLSDSRLQQKISASAGMLKKVLLISSFAVLAFIIFRIYNQSYQNTKGFERSQQQALRYKNLQLYEKALQSYQQAKVIQEPSADVKFKMALVLLQFDNQTITARRALESAIAEDSRSMQEKLEAFIGIGLSYLWEEDYKLAEENFHKALSYDSQNEAANVNLAYIKWHAGLYSEAYDFLQNQTNSGISLFLKALIVLGAQKNKISLPAGSEHVWYSIKQYLFNSNAQLAPELSLLFAYHQYISKSKDQMEAYQKEMIDQLPNISQLYAKDLRIYWKSVDWNLLDKYCLELFSKSAESPLSKSFRATCLMNTSRDYEAQKLIDEAQAEAPKDPYVLLTKAKYLYQIGRASQALIQVREKDLEILKSRTSFEAHLCLEQKDLYCAENNFNEVVQKNADDIFALAGLAEVNVENHQDGQAREYLKRGFRISNNFLPLIEVREKLEGN